MKRIPVLSKGELYAGKMCAALSRQHPRDFFDIKVMLDSNRFTESLRSVFVVYLVCTPRPIHELLHPNVIDMRVVYENEFVNMTREIIKYEELIDARDRLISHLRNGLSKKEKEFILSVKLGEPDFTLMPFENLDNFPALKWKVRNIQKIDKRKHQQLLRKLEDVLDY